MSAIHANVNAHVNVSVSVNVRRRRGRRIILMIIQVVSILVPHAIHLLIILLHPCHCHPSCRHPSRSRSSRLIVIRMMMREVWTRMRRMQRMDLQLIHLSMHPSHSILALALTLPVTLTPSQKMIRPLTLPFIIRCINIGINIVITLLPLLMLGISVRTVMHHHLFIHPLHSMLLMIMARMYSTHCVDSFSRRMEVIG